MDLRVAYIADEGYAMPLTASIRSLVDNSADPGGLAVTVLTRDFSEDTMNLVRKSCPELDLDVRPVPATTFADLTGVNYVSSATYLRLLVPSLLPDDDKVVYLDADTIVLSDLRELRDTPLRGKPVGAAQEPGRHRVSDRDNTEFWADMGIPGDTPYFNNGVMLLDMALWRELDITQKTVTCLRQHRDRLPYLDQDAVNAVLRGNWQLVSPAWNLCAEIAGLAMVAERMGAPAPVPEEFARAVRDPNVVHFVGADKPWHKASMRGPFSKAFYEYVDRTAWSGWRPA